MGRLNKISQKMLVIHIVCYKQGKYEEALNILQEAYAKKTVWDPILDRDIKKVKKAVAN
jgi:hypothetical protein